MRWYVALALLAVIPAALAAQAPAGDPTKLSREIFKELIEINTSDSAGHTAEAAQAMAKRLLDAGIPAADVRILGYEPRHQSLVARLRGRSSAAKPILLMAHLDVVDARREDWTVDPFTFLEKDGYYYGRGTNDNKSGAAALIANFVRYKQEGFVPERDLIVVLTADEETSGESIRWLLKEHRDLIDAEFALNTDGGGGSLKDGKPIGFTLQASEKVYLSFQLEVRNKGGHSSLPVRDNAIYHLSRGLARLANYDFPVRLNEVSRAFFLKSAPGEAKATGADMRALAERNDPPAAARLAAQSAYYNSVMRTTCVATRLFGGHADNALPQLARATVNCRMLPDDDPAKVEATLNRVVADPEIKISRLGEPTLSPASPLTPSVVKPIEALAGTMWPGVPVVPEMSTGASDGLYARNAGIPVYGVAALFDEVNDVRAHGRDERVGVKAFNDSVAFWYEIVKRLSGPPKA